ncbi:hypothetical protein Bbelb_373360 [Branchiostoma belcheri]|nr:hypothetical protein Bbelb_373360 [Branchiostoma belcheri]
MAGQLLWPMISPFADFYYLFSLQRSLVEISWSEPLDRGWCMPIMMMDDVMMNLYSLHMDPAYWPDPDRFDPGRFLDAEGNVINKPESFLPFSGGEGSPLNAPFPVVCVRASAKVPLVPPRNSLELLGVDCIISRATVSCCCRQALRARIVYFKRPQSWGKGHGQHSTGNGVLE